MKLEFQSHAKCLLFGAHAVLRGSSALSCPVTRYHCKILWQPQATLKKIQLTGVQGPHLQQEVLQFLHYCLQLAQIDYHKFYGILHIENTIPIAQNLGSSAALCLNVSKLFSALNFIDNKNIHNFAKKCEHYFHGTSSGFDIKACDCPEGHILMYHQGQYETIRPIWHPPLKLIPSPAVCHTKDAVLKVTRWQQQQPDNGKTTDLTMHNACLLAFRALTQPTASVHMRHKWLQKALQDAQKCYTQWGLISPKLRKTITANQAQMSATTPIGAGCGGFLLGLAKNSSINTDSSAVGNLIFHDCC